MRRPEGVYVMRKFKITLERELTFEREYVITAATREAAIDAAWERDNLVDLMSGKWTNEFRKSKAEELPWTKPVRAATRRKNTATIRSIQAPRAAPKKGVTA